MADGARESFGDVADDAKELVKNVAKAANPDEPPDNLPSARSMGQASQGVYGVMGGGNTMGAGSSVSYSIPQFAQAPNPSQAAANATAANTAKANTLLQRVADNIERTANRLAP